MAKDPYLYFQPNRIAKLKSLDIDVRRAVEGFITGLHKSPHKGFSVEFSEHREYSPGDDLRHMDWIAYGRTDRYYIKQYEQETNLRCYILLDISGSMGYKHNGDITKFEYGCFLSACLSYLMCRQQDAVGIIAFDEDVRFHLPPASSPAHLNHIFRNLETLTAGRKTSMGQTFHRLAATIAKRGLVIIISDLYDDTDEMLKGLQHFVFKKHQIILFHVFDSAETNLPFASIMRFVDMETGEKIQIDAQAIKESYNREIADFIERCRKECSDRNIEYTDVTTDTPYERMLLEYLAKRRAFLRR